MGRDIYNSIYNSIAIYRKKPDLSLSDYQKADRLNRNSRSTAAAKG